MAHTHASYTAAEHQAHLLTWLADSVSLIGAPELEAKRWLLAQAAAKAEK